MHIYISKYNRKRKNQLILLMMICYKLDLLILMVKDVIILLSEVCLHCLEEYHQLIMEVFTV